MGVADDKRNLPQRRRGRREEKTTEGTESTERGIGLGEEVMGRDFELPLRGAARTVALVLVALCVVMGTTGGARAEGEGQGASGEYVRVTLANGERAVRVTRLISAPIGDLYAAWTTGAGFTAFAGAPAEIELRRGGPFVIHWAPDSPQGEQGSEGCEVLSYVPNRMVSFTWNAPPKFPELRKEHTQVVVEFEEVAPGLVRVTLTQLGWGKGEGWDGVYDYFAHAWVYVMDRLSQHFGGRGEAGRRGWVYFISTPSRPDLLETLTDEEKATFGEHFQRLLTATRDGKVVMAGPCTDFKGPGIVLFYAEDEDAARRFMEEDPVIKAGMFKGEVHPVAMSLVREREYEGQWGEEWTGQDWRDAR